MLFELLGDPAEARSAHRRSAWTLELRRGGHVPEGALAAGITTRSLWFSARSRYARAVGSRRASAATAPLSKISRANPPPARDAGPQGEQGQVPHALLASRRQAPEAAAETDQLLRSQVIHWGRSSCILQRPSRIRSGACVARVALRVAIHRDLPDPGVGAAGDVV